jgi:hypothetical protein
VERPVRRARELQPGPAQAALPAAQARLRFVGMWLGER